MDEVYRDIYSRLYYGVEQRPLFFEPEQAFAIGWLLSPAALRLFIDQAELSLAAERKVRVRPDAKFLLLANFWQMVSLPIRLARRVVDPEIPRIISHDIAMVLNEASLRVKDGEEISGHAVIDALSRSWKNLRISGFKLWEE